MAIRNRRRARRRRRVARRNAGPDQATRHPTAEQAGAFIGKALGAAAKGLPGLAVTGVSQASDWISGWF